MISAVQGNPLGKSNGMPRALEAIMDLVRARRIDFLGLTGTNLDDAAGNLLAAALLSTPRRKSSMASKQEILELTRNVFTQETRDKLIEAGHLSGVDVKLSRVDGPALRT